MSALKLAVTMLDVTTLEGADSVGKVQQMCAKATLGRFRKIPVWDQRGLFVFIPEW